MNCVNEMSIRFLAISENESFARICVASFCSVLNPTIDEIGDIKTAVSEAVTNSIVHAYPKGIGYVDINMKLFSNNEVYISIRDYGIGIKDVNKFLWELDKDNLLTSELEDFIKSYLKYYNN